MRSRRGLRVRPEPVRVSMVRRRFDDPRTVVARSRHRPARQTRGERLLRAWSRVSVVRLVAPAGVATGDASDRLLHSETVPTRALVLRRFPAQRSCSRAMPFGVRARVALVPEPCGSVLVHANVFFARLSACPKTRGEGTGRLGAARCKRDWGESRFTARFPLRRPGDSCAMAFSSAA